MKDLTSDFKTEYFQHVSLDLVTI
ncbi:unnamed protein product, partial [Rotaria sp. Silwood1]